MRTILIHVYAFRSTVLVEFRTVKAKVNVKIYQCLSVFGSVHLSVFLSVCRFVTLLLFCLRFVYFSHVCPYVRLFFAKCV